MMQRVAAALGIEHLGTIVTPSVILTTAPGDQGSYTQVLKVRGLGVNMARISALEALSHRVADTSAMQVSGLLDDLEHAPHGHSQPAVILAVALACGAFAIILRGGVLEFIAAAVGAAAAQTVRFRMAALHLSPYLISAVCAAVATACSYILVRVLAAPSPRLGLIASVLLLVPGTPLVTSLLDLIHLDLISGVTRGVYAALLVVNMAIGMILVLVLTGFSI
jgi:uncharacterized membrane protein YjjP (DUF1212 family)